MQSNPPVSVELARDLTLALRAGAVRVSAQLTPADARTLARSLAALADSLPVPEAKEMQWIS